MLQDQVKALNEFLSSLGIKETITQHEDISITDRAFNVIHNPDDKDIVVIGGQKLDGAFGYILTIGTSQYAISADQYRRLEYFNREGTVNFSAYSSTPEYEYGKHCKFNKSPSCNLTSMRDWDDIVSIIQHILKKGNLRSVVLTSPIGSKTKFLKFKQTLPGLYKVLCQSSNRKGALKFNFIGGDSMSVMFIGNQPMILKVGIIDPMFDPVHGYMADRDQYANETPYVRKDLTPEQLEQIQANIENIHSDNKVGIIGAHDLKAGGIPMDAMNMLMAHKVVEK